MKYSVESFSLNNVMIDYMYTNMLNELNIFNWISWIKNFYYFH